MTAQVRIGVLGAARITPAAIVAAAATVPDAEVVAVAARDFARAQEFAAKHGIPAVADSYEALVERDDVTAVYNPLPNGLHGRWTMRALEAGKHVLCEKPFTANAEEAEAVAATASTTGLVAMEAMHYRYHPFATRMIELSKTLGPLRHVDTRLVGVLPMRRDIRYKLVLAGGAFMDVGCYAIHQLRSVTGAEPRVVSARAKQLSPGVDRWLQADCELPGGVTARVTGALLTGQVPLGEVRVRGTDGTLHAFFPNRPQSLGALVVRRRRARPHVERVRAEPTFVHQLRAFCDALLQGTPPLTGTPDAIANMRAIDAAYEAAGVGRRRPTP